jgi:5-(carboxyamino)imidazole ribonucleotide mutase
VNDGRTYQHWPEQRTPLVGVLCGSASDLAVMQQAGAILERFGIPYELHVMSAHRNPDLVDEFSRIAEERGMLVLICGAGMAAHLAGAVAARTALPVIGVPLSSKNLDGLDALLSTVQMPRGVPVATVSIDGAVNAAILAAQIIAVRDPTIRVRMHEFKDKIDEGVATVATVSTATATATGAAGAADSAGAGGDPPA